MNLAEARRRTKRRLGRSRVRSDDYFSFEGGLNLVDTPLKVRPGELLGVKNYEPGIRGGYRRVDGFERFDGRDKPSEASFVYMEIDSTTPANYPLVGETVTGGTSGATGILLVSVTATPAVVIGRVSGTFVDGETLSESGNDFGDVDGDPLVDLAPDDDQLATYQSAATEDLRTLIEKVPGEGAILGVVPYGGTVYAFRNHTGGATAKMFKSSAAGWVEVTLNSYLLFDDVASQEIAIEGGTVTGGTSGATATVERVGYHDGTVAGDDAHGHLVLSGISGTFVNDEILTIGGQNVGTANGAVVTQTLNPDGRYEFRIHNFYGHNKSRRLYGVDGENYAFEYDDSGVFSPIITNMVVDKPTHLGIHQQALWLSFAGGSAQLSGDADPLAWLVVLGAGEFAIGAEITGFLEEVGDALFIMTDKRTWYITGRRGTYALDEYNYETGAKEWTVQRIGQGIYLDQRAFSKLAASDQFGNFAYNAFSDKIEPLVKALLPLATASCISRKKNLYRCFFSDTRFVSIGVRGNKITAITTCDYDIPVRCIESLQEGPNGTEMIVFGSDDGYVYEADVGKSFDGDPIEAFGRLVFHYSKSPTRRKRYRHASLDVTTEGPATLLLSIDYTFASAEEPGNPAINVNADGGGGFWDISDWDEFKWSTGVVSTARFKLEGAGRNIGLLFYHSSAVESSHSLEGLTLHYSPRRLDRGTNA